jgi:hypothetical protein
VVTDGGLSISAAIGPIRPEITSPTRSATTVASLCSVHISCLASAIRELCAISSIVNDGRMLISAAMEGFRLELASENRQSYHCIFLRVSYRHLPFIANRFDARGVFSVDGNDAM